MSDYRPTTEDIQEQFVAGAMITGFAYSRDEARDDWMTWLAAHDDQVRAEERERITAQSASGTVSTISDLNGPEIAIRLDNPDDLRLFGVFQSARIARETT